MKHLEELLIDIQNKKDIHLSCPFCLNETKYKHCVVSDPKYKGKDVISYACSECNSIKYYFVNDDWPGIEKYK